MKRLFFYVGMMLFSLSVMAEDSMVANAEAAVMDSVSTTERIRKPLITESMENAIVHQDSLVARLLENMVNGAKSEIVEVPGYRVQIFSSNRQQSAKTEAMQLEKQIGSQLDVKVYVQYAPPFWKVRLGDFLTQEEAQAYKVEFIKQHPELQGDTYVVRDQVVTIK